MGDINTYEKCFIFLHGCKKFQLFLFPLKSRKFVLKLAGVFIPYTLMTGASFSCVCDYKQSYTPWRSGSRKGPVWEGCRVLYCESSGARKQSVRESERHSSSLVANGYVKFTFSKHSLLMRSCTTKVWHKCLTVRVQSQREKTMWLLWDSSIIDTWYKLPFH